MSIVINSYAPKFIMRSKDPSTLRIIDIWTFRSTKSHKRYIVEVEYFTKGFLGLKFYWKGVAESQHRYSYLTNDHEPRVIVASCINVMMEYYRRNKMCSFGFVAASDLHDESKADGPNKRFRFYRRMMLTVLGRQTFVQAYDLENSIYLLINRAMLESGKIDLETIGREISLLYEGEYSLTTDGSESL